MSVAAINPGDLEASVSGHDLVLVECWAPTCGACKQFDPVFEKVAEEHPQHRFLRLDITAESGFSEALGIDHTPALMVYREGILLFRQPGNYERDQLADIVRQAANIDMDMVRADIAAASADGESHEDGS
jgi:thioredoxin-like negative regulator of GroEL